jgi:hypothetical protein
MRHIRPHKLLNLVEPSSYQQRMVRIVLPEQRSPILLESAASREPFRVEETMLAFCLAELPELDAKLKS